MTVGRPVSRPPRTPAPSEPESSIDDSAAFERLAASWADQRYTLRLYVTGMTPRSSMAIRCLRSVCEERLQGRYEMEVIDVYQQPELAQEAQLLAMPTMVKYSPPPARRLVGDMTDTARVLAGLDLPFESAS